MRVAIERVASAGKARSTAPLNEKSVEWATRGSSQMLKQEREAKSNNRSNSRSRNNSNSKSPTQRKER